MKKNTSSCQGVTRLFVLSYDNTADNNQVSVDSYKNTFFQEYYNK